MTNIFYSQFAYYLHAREIQLDGKNPHLTKLQISLRVIHIWLWYETLQNRAQGNINSLVVKYVQVWNRILPQNI